MDVIKFIEGFLWYYTNTINYIDSSWLVEKVSLYIIRVIIVNVKKEKLL